MDAQQFKNTLAKLTPFAKIPRCSGAKLIELRWEHKTLELVATHSKALQLRAKLATGRPAKSAAVYIRANVLNSWLGKLSAGELARSTITLDLDEENRLVDVNVWPTALTHGASGKRLVLPHEPIKPKEQKPELAENLGVIERWKADGWAKAFRESVRCMGDVGDEKYIMYKLASSLESDGAKLWATDGHRLSSFDTPIRWPIARTHGDLAKALVKLGSVIDWAAVFSTGSENTHVVQLFASPRSKLCPSISLVSTCEDPSFPPVRSIAVNSLNFVKLSRSELAHALVQARAIDAELSSFEFVCDGGGGRYTLVIASEALEEIEELFERPGQKTEKITRPVVVRAASTELEADELSGCASGRSAGFRVNTKYMLDALEQLRGADFVRLGYSGRLDPITLEAGGVRLVVMPVRS